jgi:transposase
VNDRRVISGILHRYREGLRWRTIPAEYGPRTTLFNRFNRWSEKGIWQALLAALAACEDPPEIAMVDSTAVRAHRSAAGAKGGSRAKPSVARAAARRPRSMRSPTAPAASMP